MKAAIFTINTKLYEEKKGSEAGAVMKKILTQNGVEVRTGVLPEDEKVIAQVLKQLADSGTIQLLITAGSNGPLLNDCAPAAIRDVADKLLPGIPEAIRANVLTHTKKAISDCSEAGVCQKMVMVNMPANAKSAQENLNYIVEELITTVEAINQ